MVTEVKDEDKTPFAEALLNLAQSFKNETENCGKMCGGLTEKEMAVIIFVGQNDNVKMSDIADNIVAPVSTLTNITDKLVDKKLLVRDHSVEDRRVINVSLSGTGRTAYNGLIDKRKKLIESILSGMDDSEARLMLKHLKLLSAEIGRAR